MLAHTPSLLQIKLTDEPRGLKRQAFEDRPFSPVTWKALLQLEKNYNQGHDPAQIPPGHRYRIGSKIAADEGTKKSQATDMALLAERLYFLLGEMHLTDVHETIIA
jgi:hypothetical protein